MLLIQFSPFGVGWSSSSRMPHCSCLPDHAAALMVHWSARAIRPVMDRVEGRKARCGGRDDPIAAAQRGTVGR